MIGGPPGIFLFLASGEYHFKKLPLLYEKNNGVPESYSSISLFDQNNKKITAKFLEGKIVIVNYMAKGCPYNCKIDGKMMKQIIYNELTSAKGFKDVVIITETNDSTTAGRKVIEESLDVNGEKWKFAYSKNFSFFNIDLPNGNPFTSTDKKYKGGKKFERCMMIIDKEKRVRGFIDSSADIEFKRLMEELRLLKKEYGKRKKAV